ncbi:hypothetical protein [Kribbella sp. NPDC051770]|uniref:hypothetical protein n=1 Tax=Kribbella sp. NPDC051770 TaxID=3155413 RepID=UPI00342E58E2
MNDIRLASPAVRVRAVLLWLVVNVVLAYLLLYPLGLGELAVRHFLAVALDGPWSPFVNDPGDLQASIYGFVLFGCPLLALAVVINRRLHRSTGGPAILFWLATVALLVAPLAISGLFDLTLMQAFGKGLFW